MPWWGLSPLFLKKCFEGGPNCSSHSKLLALINVQCFHIRVCRTKIPNRDYLEHWSGNILLFCDAVISYRLWDLVCVAVYGSDVTITSRVCRQNWLPKSCRKRS